MINSSPFVCAMMTAAEIAKELGCPTVGINYRATEFLSYILEASPMDDLELSFYDFDFKEMRKHRSTFTDAECFPEGVTFKDSTDYKDEIFSAFPEKLKTAAQRGLKLLEGVSKRIYANSCWNRDNVCYLVVGHGM